METFPVNMQVLDARRDLSGGYKVDITRGERVGRVLSERFLSLGELDRSVRDRAERSRSGVVETTLSMLKPSAFMRQEQVKNSGMPDRNVAT